MKKVLGFAIALTCLIGNPNAVADSELRYSGFGMFHLYLSDDTGSQVVFSGTYEQIQNQIQTLQQTSIQ